jgi:hypothetical protein
MIGAELPQLLQIAGFALFGLYGFNVLLQRYSEGPVSWWHYPLILAGAGLCFYPLNWQFNIIGAVLISATTYLSLLNYRRSTRLTTK